MTAIILPEYGIEKKNRRGGNECGSQGESILNITSWWIITNTTCRMNI
jgi:hypothetical protein